MFNTPNPCDMELKPCQTICKSSHIYHNNKKRGVKNGN